VDALRSHHFFLSHHIITHAFILATRLRSPPITPMVISISSNSIYTKKEDDDDEDPLNMLPFPSVTQPVAKKTGSIVINGRTLRPRQSLAAAEESKKPKRESTERGAKRARPASSVGEENLEQPAKKIKVERDKAVCHISRNFELSPRV
jgi:hypothetical protein